MDFDQAIAAHSTWKSKLRSYLSKPDGSLKPADVSADNKCPLGQWIYTDGPRYSKMPEYANLKSEHARFHKIASDVVRRADSGQSVSEETALGANSEFSKASSAVVVAILAMKRQVPAK
jgi:Chemoreceptor zinc-binding domain